MATIWWQTARALIDFVLFGIMIHLEIYEFTDAVLVLIAIRIIVGHYGRVLRYVLRKSSRFLVGFFANVIKAFLECAIISNLNGDIPSDFVPWVVICIFLRRGCEVASLYEAFNE